MILFYHCLMVYSALRLASRLEEGNWADLKQSPACDLFKITLAIDALLIISLVAISILAYAGWAPLQTIFPIGFVVLIMVGSFLAVSTLAFLIINGKREKTTPPLATQDTLTTPPPAIEPQKTNEVPINEKMANFIARHFDLEAEIIKMWLESQEYKNEEMVAALQAKEGEPALTQLEQSLKKALKKFYKMTEEDSPVALSAWEDIPLKKILILSDKLFYDLSPYSIDLIYLEQHLKAGGDNKSPKASDYTPTDRSQYQEKKKILGLKDEECLPTVKNPPQPKPKGIDWAPYRELENLLTDLSEVVPNGDFQTALVPYVETLERPEVQNLLLPNKANTPFGQLNLYNENLHKVAIWLWNGLKRSPYSSQMGALPPKMQAQANYHGILLL